VPYKYIPLIDGGMNKANPAEVLKDNESPDLKNVFLREGLVCSDTGYITFGDTIAGSPAAIEQLWLKAGTSKLVLITTLTVYDWTNAEWELVSNGTETTVNGDQTNPVKNLLVAASAGFTAGERMGVMIKNNGTTKMHMTTVDTVPDGTHVTMDDAIPVGWTAKNTYRVLEAVALTGNLNYPVSVAPWVAGDWLMFTNFTNCPKRYDGTDCVDIPNLETDVGSAVRAKAIIVFENHVLLLGMDENSVALPQRIRWCDTGDPTEWAVGTGVCGFEDLYDEEDFLLSAAHIGQDLVIYRERVIYRGTYIGTVQKLFSFDAVISGEGVVGSAAACNLGDMQLFMGHGNFYKYLGGQDLTPVGDAVYELCFGINSIIDPSSKKRTQAVYIEETDEVWFLVPKTGSTELDMLIRYNVSRNAWYIREFSHSVTCVGLYARTADLGWDEDTPGSWDEDAGPWDSSAMLASAPTTLLGGYSPAQIYEYNYLASDDSGVDFTWYFETKDLYHAEGKVRVEHIKLKCTGSTVTVYYSTDRGANWTSLGTVTLSSLLTDHKVWRQVVTDVIRLKLEGTSSGFALQSIGLSIEPESDW